MEPFPGTILSIAPYHITETYSVAITVCSCVFTAVCIGICVGVRVEVGIVVERIFEEIELRLGFGIGRRVRDVMLVLSVDLGSFATRSRRS